MPDKREFRFTVLGTPQGKARHRTTKVGNTYTPQKTVDYENLVGYSFKQQCKGAVMIEKGLPVKAEIFAFYQRPKRPKYKLPLVKPDLDNICKAILDSLNGIAFYDDAQVANILMLKFYSDNPRVEVIIKEL